VTRFKCRRALLRILTLPLLWTATLTVADEQPGRFGTQAEELNFPSIGRVVAGFVATAVIAAGAALVVRKAWPLIVRQTVPATGIRALSRATLSRTLTVHLVEVDGVRMIVAEHRAAVAVVVINETRPPGPNA
jgi:hypothetical protein